MSRLPLQSLEDVTDDSDRMCSLRDFRAGFDEVLSQKGGIDGLTTSRVMERIVYNIQLERRGACLFFPWASLLRSCCARSSTCSYSLVRTWNLADLETFLELTTQSHVGTSVVKAAHELQFVKA